MKNIEFDKKIKSILNKYNHKLKDDVYYFKNSTLGDFKLKYEYSNGLGCIYFRFISDYFNLDLFNQLFSNSVFTFNRFSYKWNIISSDINFLLNEIEERLDNLNWLNSQENVNLVLAN